MASVYQRGGKWYLRYRDGHGVWRDRVSRAATKTEARRLASEMERRCVLQRALAGERVEVPARLCIAAEDHLNADVWRAGLVPSTDVVVAEADSSGWTARAHRGRARAEDGEQGLVDQA